MKAPPLALLSFPHLAAAGVDISSCAEVLSCQLPGCRRLATVSIAGAWDLCEKCRQSIYRSNLRESVTGKFKVYGQKYRPAWVDGERRTKQWPTERLDKLPGRDEAASIVEAFESEDAVKTIIANAHLPFRTAEILRLRYSHPNYTLDEIGRVFKISRERVRMIEVDGLKKLELAARRKSLPAPA